MPAVRVLDNTPSPYDALTFWDEISVNLVVIEPALILVASLSASSLVKLPVIITSLAKPSFTVAADRQSLLSEPHDVPSLLYELTPCSKLYHITIKFSPSSLVLISEVTSWNFSLSLIP